MIKKLKVSVNKKNVVKTSFKFDNEALELFHRILLMFSLKTVIIKCYQVKFDDVLLKFLTDNDIRYVTSLAVKNGCCKDAAFILNCDAALYELLELLFENRVKTLELLEKNDLFTWEEYLYFNRYIFNMKKIRNKSNVYMKIEIDKKRMKLLYHSDVYDSKLITDQLNSMVN